MRFPLVRVFGVVVVVAMWLFILRRPLNYVVDNFQVDWEANTGEFLDSFRHLYWLFGGDPEYYRGRAFVGFVAGVIASVVVHTVIAGALIVTTLMLLGIDPPQPPTQESGEK